MNKGLTGKSRRVTEAVNITTNKNTIPFDPESPFITSGVRIEPSSYNKGNEGRRDEKIAEIMDLALDEKVRQRGSKAKGFRLMQRISSI